MTPITGCFTPLKSSDAPTGKSELGLSVAARRTDHEWRSGRVQVLRSEYTSALRMHAKGLKEIRRDGHRLDLRRAILILDGPSLRTEALVRQRLVGASSGFEQRAALLGAKLMTDVPLEVDPVQPTGRADVERRIDHRVEHAVHGRVQRDGQPKRQERGDRESGVACE